MSALYVCVLITYMVKRWHYDALWERGSVIIWAMFCWKILSPGIYVDVDLTHIKFQNITDDQAHLFIGAYVLMSVASFSWITDPTRLPKLYRQGLRIQIPQVAKCGIFWTNKSKLWRPRLASYKR